MSQRQPKETSQEPREEKKISSKYNKQGEIRLCNEGQMNFSIWEYDHEETTYFTLEVPKAIETKDIDIEILKEHISIRVKEKLL